MALIVMNNVSFYKIKGVNNEDKSVGFWFTWKWICD